MSQQKSLYRYLRNLASTSLGLSPLFFPYRWTRCVSTLAVSPKPNCGCFYLLHVHLVQSGTWGLHPLSSTFLSQSADLITFHVFHPPAACLSISMVHHQVISGLQCRFFLLPGPTSWLWSDSHCCYSFWVRVWLMYIHLLLFTSSLKFLILALSSTYSLLTGNICACHHIFSILCRHLVWRTSSHVCWIPVNSVVRRKVFVVFPFVAEILKQIWNQ